MEEDLYLMMSGAVSILKEEGIALAGGHSAEGAELCLGFAVTGELAQEPLGKVGLLPGDALILTRALGSGVLLAGQMQGRTRSRWVQKALAEMMRSNRAAAGCLLKFGARSCTDVTGFGLLGHLKEMCQASAVHGVLELEDIPLYEGALETMGPLQNSVQSSLQPQNEIVFKGVEFQQCLPEDTRVRLLADPQTAGGLLAGIPEKQAQACVRALQELGYADACIVGRVSETAAMLPRSGVFESARKWLKIHAADA